jgi:hypothetical protein
MHRCLGLVLCTAAIGALPASVAPAAFGAGEGEPPHCAQVVTKTVATGLGSPAPGTAASCWVEEPYPFVQEGDNDEGGAPTTQPTGLCGENVLPPCYLTVTSMTFKAWNRGRAVTTNNQGQSMVWTYNGTQWGPEPAFSLQRNKCLGTTIIAASKGDYWLINANSSDGQPWQPLCRFDREENEWGPIEIPKSVAQQLTYIIHPGEGPPNEAIATRGGGITSGTCFAWNNCWFFGSYGVVLHWSEKLVEPEPGKKEQVLALREAPSPAVPGLLPGGEFLAAAARHGPGAEEFALVVGSNSEGETPPSFGEPPPGSLQKEAGGEPPAQLYSSIGGEFSPIGLSLPSGEGHPFNTKLTAVDVSPAGQGWVAGNPAEQSNASAPQPAPLLEVSGTWKSASCAAPPEFTYAPAQEQTEAEERKAVAGAFAWSSVAAIPDTGEAFFGGSMRRTSKEVIAGDPSEDATREPVIAQVSCGGTTTLTRFRTEESTSSAEQTAKPAPADREGEISALAASAPNDAWATTRSGTFRSGAFEPPRLYHFTNGRTPEAEAGNEAETRTTQESKDESFAPPPPAPAPPAPVIKTTTTKKTVKLPAAIYDVKAAVRSSTVGGSIELNLYITFRLRRTVTVGAHALRNGRVVSVAPVKRFGGRSGTLVLHLSRQRWPTKITFVS